MTTTDLIPFLKGYLEGKETLDKQQVEYIKKTLKEVYEPLPPVSIPATWPTVSAPYGSPWTITSNPFPNALIPQVWYNQNGGTTSNT